MVGSVCPDPVACSSQAAAVAEEDGIECEVIDLRTLLPWDRETVGGHMWLETTEYWKQLQVYQT